MKEPSAISHQPSDGRLTSRLLLERRGGLQVCRVKNEQGMTLVEVLVAVALIGLCAIPMLQLFSSSALSRVSGRYTTTATALASAVMDEVRAGKYDVGETLPTGKQTLAQLSDYPDYTRQLEVSGSGGLKTVTVTVSWTKGSTGTRSIKLTTQIDR